MLTHAQRISSLLASDKEFAPCRIESRAYDAERGVGREAGGRVRQRRRERRASAWGLEPEAAMGATGQPRAERTLNIPLIVMTLDVSKVSGWLNAAADCRVESRTYDAG